MRPAEAPGAALDGLLGRRSERLGGIHLLSQGIYGFKAEAPGAATDLILSEPLDEREIMRASEGLVLTEWKWVSEADALTKYAEARAQAQIYS